MRVLGETTYFPPVTCAVCSLRRQCISSLHGCSVHIRSDEPPLLAESRSPADPRGPGQGTGAGGS
jgi:hypothetical protein